MALPCDELRQGLSDLQTEVVKSSLDNLLRDLHPAPTTNDRTGHEENLITFISRLNGECDIESVIECYACIKTLPAQSEVRVSFDSVGIPVVRTLDIKTPTDDVMSVLGIHL